MAVITGDQKKIEVSGEQIEVAIAKIPTIEADIKKNASEIEAVQSTVSQQTESISALDNNKANAADVYSKEETIQKIAEKIAEIIANAPEELDTLKEMSDWLTEHEDSAAAMNTAILKNTADIATKMNKSDIVTLTQAEYDALTEKTAPFYFIKGSDDV